MNDREITAQVLPRANFIAQVIHCLSLKRAPLPAAYSTSVKRMPPGYRLDVEV